MLDEQVSQDPRRSWRTPSTACVQSGRHRGLLHASYGGKPGRECTVAPPGGNYRRPGVAVFSTTCSKSISLTLPCRPRAKSVVPSPSWRRSPR